MEIERSTNTDSEIMLFKTVFKEDQSMFSNNCNFSCVNCLHKLEKVIDIPSFEISYSDTQSLEDFYNIKITN